MMHPLRMMLCFKCKRKTVHVKWGDGARQLWSYWRCPICGDGRYARV